MANVKNFGLIGVGSDLQFSKGGARVKQFEGAFTLRNAADNADTSLTASALTASTGNITATLGDIVASAGNLTATLGNLDLLSSSATITIGAGSPANTASLSLAADGVFQFDGTAAFRAPSGNDAQRPTGQVGMIRVNTQAGAGAGILEFYNGTSWVTAADNAVVSNLITSLGSFVNANGTYNASAFAGVPGIGSPTSDLTDVIVEYTTYADTAFIKVDGTNAMAANLDMGSNRITNMADPVGDQDAATKYYVDNAIEGLHWKKAANLLASYNVSLTGLTPLVIDGYTLTAAENGYRILLIDQDGSPGDEENGIYVFNEDGLGNYTLTRASDANTPEELNGASVFILEGTQYEGTAWVQVNHYLVTSFAGQEWVQFAGGGAYTATNGVTITGTVISANVDGVTIRNNGGDGTQLAVKSSATAGQTLISQGTGDAVWGALDLSDGDAVTGTLPIEHGGTGKTSFGQDRVVFADPTSPVGSLTDSANFTYVDATQILTVGSVVIDGINDDVTTTTLFAQNVTSSGDLTLTAAAGQDVVIADNGTTGSVLDFASGDVTIKAGADTRLYINASGAVAFSDGSSPTADFGIAGQFLKSNGPGAAPTWSDASGLDAAGNNTEVQFNDGGVFGAISTFTFNKTTTVMTLGDLTFDGSAGSPNNVKVSATNANSDLTLESNGTGDIVLDPKSGSVRVVDLTATRVVFVGADGALVDSTDLTYIDGSQTLNVGSVIIDGGNDDITTTTVNAQNVTSTGDLTLTAAAGQDVVIADNGTTGSVLDFASGDVTIKAGADTRLYINASGAVAFSDGSSPTADFGVSGQFLKSNGPGAAPTWSDASALDAAGNNTEVQFNDGGVFGADAQFTYDKTTNALTVGDITLAGGAGSPTNVTISAVNTNSALTLESNGTGDLVLDPKNGNVRVTDLTATRVVFVGTAGALVDDSDFTFDSTTTVLSVGAVALDGATANTIIIKSGATERLRINEFGAVSFSDDGTSPNNDYGIAGQFLKSNGYGAAPSWADASQLDAAGSDTQVQFNDGGLFGADAEFTYNKNTNTLTVGDLTFAGGTGSPSNVTISAANLNSDLTLSTTGNGDIVLNAGGSVIIGDSGAGVIESGVGETLSVTGDTGLTLGVNSGNVTINLPAGSPFGVVTVSGPTAQEYADAITNSDLVNKLYVDQAIASGASAGAVKAYQATVNLNANGSTNIGSAMPAGATVLRVKVSVTGAATGTTSLQVGKSGGSEYMTTTENDLQTAGLYLAECFVTEAGSVQLQATVANATSGTAIVIVEYQVAQ